MKKSVEVWFHISAWLLLMGVVVSMFWQGEGRIKMPMVGGILLYAGWFYVHAFVLYRKFWRNGKRPLYFGLLAFGLLFFLSANFVPAVRNPELPGKLLMIAVAGNVLFFAVMTSASTWYAAMRLLSDDDRHADRLFVLSPHIFIWAVVTIVLFVLAVQNPNAADKNGALPFLVLLFTIFHAGMFYVQTEWLIPKFLDKNAWISYILLTFLLVAGVVGFKIGFHTGLDRMFQPEAEWRAPGELFRGAIGLNNPFFIFAALLFFYARKAFRQNRRNKDIARKKLEAELALLRTQVNPHFLFNTLNNLYAMATRSGDADTASGISQLAGLMRYMLYEGNAAKISLAEEFEYLEKFIALQKLRLGAQHSHAIEVDLPDVSPNPSITPMLLIPFIENAFKYGLSNRKPSWVRIAAKLDGPDFTFSVRNSNHAATFKMPSGASGFGLQNVRKRLALIYEKNHTLEIGNTPEEFSVVLKLNLDADA